MKARRGGTRDTPRRVPRDRELGQGHLCWCRKVLSTLAAEYAENRRRLATRVSRVTDFCATENEQKTCKLTKEERFVFRSENRI
jgi:hypothetical protein